MISLSAKSKSKAIDLFDLDVPKNNYISGRVNRKTILLSRFIMNETDPNIFIDHIDSDKFNYC